MLVGASHGDLHARNVLVSRLENEVGQVALFDYGEMHLANLVGWDFVKLETELKVRIYPHLFRRTRGSFVREVHAFERRLCERTENFHHDRPDQDGEKETDERRERLAGLLLEIRRQAQRFLGRQRDGLHAWLEEYYFLLVCYGVQAARFPTFGIPELLGAYVGAGTVARRLSLPWRELDEQIARAREEAETILHQANSPGVPGFAPVLAEDAKALTATFSEPGKQIGHHARLAFARVWIQADLKRQRPFIEAAVALLDELRKDYRHVLEITEVRLLGQLDLGEHAEADRELAKLVRHNVELSYEILCRLGRLFKDRGELAWPEGQPALPPAVRRDFELALAVYRRAWRQSRNYYPGVNVAALLFLLGQDSEAADYATLVLQAARQQAGEDHWAVITQGDAHFLLSEHEHAASCYRSVRGRCTPQNLRSVLRQMRLLLRRLGKEEAQKHWARHRLEEVFGKEAVQDVLGAEPGG
jgi:tetratricopeptide (TPR) repeat protein